MQPHEKAKAEREASDAGMIGEQFENLAVEAFRQYPPEPGASLVLSGLIITLANAIFYECLLTGGCPHKALMLVGMALDRYVLLDGVSMLKRPLMAELQRIAGEKKIPDMLH